jgi:threonine dehydrogenase-like Zn-dependent dehydrogenase
VVAHSWDVFNKAEIKPGEWVLVTAAAGGMGVLIVQLAHAAGARVAAAARGERKLDLARELGAEIAVDYAEPGWADRVRDATGGAGPDVVFDGAGGEIGASRALKSTDRTASTFSQPRWCSSMRPPLLRRTPQEGSGLARTTACPVPRRGGTRMCHAFFGFYATQSSLHLRW